MGRQAVEQALGEAKAALARAYRALPREARQNPEASVKWRVEQAQRHVQAAGDVYYPEVKDAPE